MVTLSTSSRVFSMDIFRAIITRYFMMDIFEAIENNNIARVEELVKDKSFNFYQVNSHDETPLHCACYKNNLAMVRLLLDSACRKLGQSRAKESVNKTTKDGWTPLHCACYQDNPDMVKLLFANGAKKSVNIANSYDWTPLFYACNKNNLEIVRLLLDYACSELGQSGLKEFVNKADNDGLTPLYCACYKNNLEMVKLLLPYCTKETINKANKYGETLIDYSCHENNLEMVRLLLEYGAKVDKWSIEKVQTNLRRPEKQAIAKQILNTLNLTQRFDKWVKTGQYFDLTKEEKNNIELKKFMGGLFKSKRAEIMQQENQINIFAFKSAPERDLVKEDKISDCRIRCLS